MFDQLQFPSSILKVGHCRDESQMVPQIPDIYLGSKKEIEWNVIIYRIEWQNRGSYPSIPSVYSKSDIDPCSPHRCQAPCQMHPLILQLRKSHPHILVSPHPRQNLMLLLQLLHCVLPLQLVLCLLFLQPTFPRHLPRGLDRH